MALKEPEWLIEFVRSIGFDPSSVIAGSVTESGLTVIESIAGAERITARPVDFDSEQRASFHRAHLAAFAETYELVESHREESGGVLREDYTWRRRGVATETTSEGT